MRILIDNYLHQLHEIYEGNPWIDETINKKINSLSEVEAFVQPITGVHSPAELLSHMVEWRKAAIRTFQGMPYQSLEDSENWKSNKVLGKTGWKELKEEFKQTQIEIFSILKNENDGWLNKVYNNGQQLKYLVDGLLHHDIYHLGQLGIVIKLLNNKINESTVRSV